MISGIFLPNESAVTRAMQPWSDPMHVMYLGMYVTYVMHVVMYVMYVECMWCEKKVYACIKRDQGVYVVFSP